nr:Hsp33 family molecular chaperone HslO [Aminipila luticellarii]
MVEEARKIHNTTPLATAGLGRVLTGAGLMGLMLKGQRDNIAVTTACNALSRAGFENGVAPVGSTNR